MVFKQKLQQRAKKSIASNVVKKFSIFDVIVSPIVTEKSYKFHDVANKYFFKIHRNANKNDVKAAIQYLYKVTPEAVNIVNVVSKNRSQRGLVRKAYKKAIVTLSKKDKIEIGL
ncbi:TPA: 50S ribosomal protein L23 [Patescibacteria group bacterium]|nr:50S ribosomal protein L23 [Candidatus Gracilibacteria bacterium]